MTATEWDDELRLQHAVASRRPRSRGRPSPVPPASTFADDSVDVELVAHRVGNLLGLRLRAAAAAIELVGPVDAATGDRLAGWLDHRNATS